MIFLVNLMYKSGDTSGGVIKGSILAIKRLTKCHPWGKSGYDPVNKQKKKKFYESRY